SGNTKTPDDTWSDWVSAGTNPDGRRIDNPKARFLQYKAEFSTNDTKITPILRSVSIAYLQQNLRPDILSINIMPPSMLYRKTQIYPQETFAGLSQDLSEETTQPQPSAYGQSSFEINPLGKSEFRKGYRTVIWNAVDQNNDEMRYELDYRLDN